MFELHLLQYKPLYALIQPTNSRISKPSGQNALCIFASACPNCQKRHVPLTWQYSDKQHRAAHASEARFRLPSSLPSSPG